MVQINNLLTITHQLWDHRKIQRRLQQPSRHHNTDTDLDEAAESQSARTPTQ